MRGPEGHTQLAREWGISLMPIRRWRENAGWQRGASAVWGARELTDREMRQEPNPTAGPLGSAGAAKNADGVTTLTSPPLDGAIGDAEKYLRERWGFPTERWICLSAIGNEWQGGDGDGGVRTYTQVKGSFRPISDIRALLPEPAAFHSIVDVRRLRKRQQCAVRWQCVVLADHQAPYIDNALHAATLSMIHDLAPRKIAHIGDLCDYTNISKHKDHAVVKASVDECTQAGTDILVGLRNAAPDAEIQILEGNHDVRPMSELLLRAERMAGVRAGDLHDGKGREELLSVRKLWRLDELGIELVSDPRGWQHAELEIVPGPKGLVAVHGWLTGANVAARTLEKVGRSVILGHTHGPEHVFQWSKQLQIEQQAMVVGCQCAVRGNKHFPTFVPRDGWLQGPAIVTVYGDGEFTLERARWNGSTLVTSHGLW